MSIPSMALGAVLGGILAMGALTGRAQDAIAPATHYHGGIAAPASSVTSSAPTSFAHRMDDAMVKMNRGMSNASMTGTADHDFAAMMIPHHQGAIDMAMAELVDGTDPVLRRLAQEIIVTQGSEIAVMQDRIERMRMPQHPHP